MLPLYYLRYLKVQTDEKIKIMMDEYKPQGVLNLIPLAATISHDASMSIKSGVD